MTMAPEALENLSDELAAALTKLTGDDWTVEPGTYVASLRPTRARDGLTIHLYEDHLGKGRATYSPDARRLRQAWYSERIPKIGITLTRPADALARDIVRRLIPDAEEMHETLARRAKAQGEYEDKVKATMATLAAEGITFAGDDPRRGYGPMTGDVSVEAHALADAVSLNIRTLPTDIAMQVLRLVLGASK